MKVWKFEKFGVWKFITRKVWKFESLKCLIGKFQRLKQIQTNKKLFLESTIGTRKIVVPNTNPFTFISRLSKEAVSASGSPHYLFFENPNGFHFRSLDSLLGRKQELSVPHKATYKFQPPDPNEPPEVSSTNILHWELQLFD